MEFTFQCLYMKFYGPATLGSFVLPRAAFAIGQNCAVSKTIWPPQPEIFTALSFRENICWPFALDDIFLQTTFTFASGREQGCSQSQISLIQLKGRDGLKAGISDCRASGSPVPSSCCRRAPRASLPGRAPLPSLRGSQNRFLVLSLPAIFPRLSDTSHLLGKWTPNTRLFSQDVFPKILAPIPHALLAPRCLQAKFSFK